MSINADIQVWEKQAIEEYSIGTFYAQIFGGVFVYTEAEEEMLRYHNLYNAVCVMSCHY